LRKKKKLSQQVQIFGSKRCSFEIFHKILMGI
jgi:hypothetical protein